MEGHSAPVSSADPWAELPEEAIARIKSELDPGERLLWAAGSLREPGVTGGEGCAVVSDPATALLLGVGLPALAVGLSPAAHRGLGEAAGILGVLGALLGTIGLLVGLGYAIQVVERRSMAGRNAMRLSVLTDRRVIRWEPHWDRAGIAVRSHPLNSIGEVWRVDYPDGLGDVLFRAFPRRPQEYGIEPDTHSIPGIVEVRRVEMLLRSRAGPTDTSWADSPESDDLVPRSPRID